MEQDAMYKPLLIKQESEWLLAFEISFYGRLLDRAVYDLIQTLDRWRGVYKTSAWRLFEMVN